MCGEFNYKSKYAKGTQLFIYVTFSSQYVTLKVNKLDVLLWLKDKYLWLVWPYKKQRKLCVASSDLLVYHVKQLKYIYFIFSKYISLTDDLYKYHC